MPSLTHANPTALPIIPTQTSLHRWATRAATVALASAFVAVCAHIALRLPFSPVPLTLQTFAVLLVGLTLGPAMGAATLAAYLVEGLCGLPVFAPISAGGIAQLAGPTGGYLLSYPAAAAIAGYLSIRLSRFMPRVAANITAGAFAIEFILGMGALWLGMLTHASLSHVVIMAVVPFLPGEAVKILAAAGIASAWMRLRQPAA
jgi:biotin transport system substrate-specific component